MLTDKNQRIEYMCKYCGTKVTRYTTAGRPMPGNCARKPKTKDGKMQPHTWVINRKLLFYHSHKLTTPIGNHIIH